MEPEGCLTLALALALLTLQPAKEVPSVGRIMSVYSDSLAGRKMANGKKYDLDALTVASNDWKLGTKLRLTYGEKSVVVTVTDRMARRFSGKRVDASRRVWRTLTNGAKPGLRKVRVRKA
jgi:rare lipoprotein A